MIASDWFWHDGHLGWPLFALVSYTLILLLLADFTWRMVVIPVRWLAAGLGVIWLAGLLILWLA